jgi:Ubiquitin carboxyl-terminal hydrolase
MLNSWINFADTACVPWLQQWTPCSTAHQPVPVGPTHAGCEDHVRNPILSRCPPALQVFMEDLPEDEQDVTGMAHYGAGLENLGNTCYMNSTLQVPSIQCCRWHLSIQPALAAFSTKLFEPTEILWIPQATSYAVLLRRAGATQRCGQLRAGPQRQWPRARAQVGSAWTEAGPCQLGWRNRCYSGGDDCGHAADLLACRLAAAARDLFKDLQRSAQPVPPLAFWLGLRAAFPQFNQQSNTVRSALRRVQAKSNALQHTCAGLLQPQLQSAACSWLPQGRPHNALWLPQGGFSQQDAEECWTQLMYSLRTVVAVRPSSSICQSILPPRCCRQQVATNAKHDAARMTSCHDLRGVLRADATGSSAARLEGC